MNDLKVFWMAYTAGFRDPSKWSEVAHWLVDIGYTERRLKIVMRLALVALVISGVALIAAEIWLFEWLSKFD